MNIIIIGPAHPFRGGIADTNESFCRAFTKNGHHASIITFTLQYPNFLFPGKTQYSSEPKPTDISISRHINTINPLSWLKVAQIINQQQPQLVIIRYWLPFLAPCLGSIARLLHKNTKLVAMCDNIIPHEKRVGDEWFTKYFVGAFDGFITLSNTVKAELNQFTDKPKMYQAHPINDNLGDKIPKSEARRYLQLEETGKYLLFFGLVRKYKGLDLMLKAMGESVLKELNVKLLVVGEFYDNPQDYYTLIEQYGLQDKVIIKNEFIAANELKYYFSAADMVTQTYHTASQSGVTQIAFHFDCPMLVTNVGGLSEVVLHDKIGYVTPKNPLDIALAIHDFYEHNKSSIFVENIKIEKEKYSWTKFAESVVNFYQNI